MASPRSRADSRSRRTEWADEEAQDTLAGTLWETVQATEALENEISALKKKLAGIEEEHAADKARLNERWQLKIEEQASEHQRSTMELTASFEDKLVEQERKAKATQERLQANVQSLTSMLDAEKRKHESTQAELDHTQMALGKADEKITQQGEIIRGLKTDRDSLRAEISSRLDQINMLKKDVASLEGSVKNKDRTIAELELKINALTSQLSEAMHTIEQSKLEMDRIRKEAEEKYAKLMSEIETITGVKVNVSNLLTVEQTASRSLKSEIDKLLKAIADLKLIAEENERNKLKIRELEGVIREKDLQIDSVAAECQRIRKESEKRLDLLTQEIESITGQKITVDGHLNVERTTTEKLQDEMQRLLRTIDQLTKIAEENEANKKVIRTLEAQIAGHNAVVASLQDENQKEKARGAKALREQKDDYERQLREAADQLLRTQDDYERKIQVLKSDMAAMQQDHESKVKAMLGEMESQRKQAQATMDAQKEDYERQLRELKAYYEGMMKDYEAQIQELKDEIHFLRISQGHLKLKSMLQRWRNMEVAVAMTEWVKVVEEAKAQKAFQAMLDKMSAKDRAEALRKLEYMIHSWNGAYLPMAFMDWKQIMVMERQHQGKAEYAAKKVAKMNMVFRFHNWTRNAKGLSDERYQKQIADLQADLKECERQLEAADVAAEVAAKAALAKHSLLEARCEALQASEGSAKLSRDSSERKVLQLKKSMTNTNREHQQMLLLEKKKQQGGEEALQRAETALKEHQAASQERIGTAEGKTRELADKHRKSQRAAEQYGRDNTQKDRKISTHAEEIAMWERKCEALQRALDAEPEVELNKEIDVMQDQLAQKIREAGASYDACVLAEKKAELAVREKEVMEGRIKTTLAEIEALRASWVECVEETREARAHNEALSAHNYRLELEYNNISVQLEEAMSEAAKSQMKMLEVLRDVSALREARDKGYAELDSSERQKMSLQEELGSMLDNLKDAYMEVEGRKGDMYRLGEKLQRTNSALEDVTYQKTAMQQNLMQEIEARDKSVADLEAAKTRVEKKLYKVTDNMVQAQKRWNVAETDLDRLRTDIVEYEEMASSMQDYAGDMYDYQDAMCNDLDRTFAISTSSQYLSLTENSKPSNARSDRTRYIHGPA